MAEIGDQGADEDVDWRDRLVELHILADSGDATAAATAARRCTSDPVARQAWDDVARACELLLNEQGVG